MRLLSSGFEDTVEAWTDGAGVDVILDSAGGARSVINLGMLMMKRARVVGSTLQARPTRSWRATRP